MTKEILDEIDRIRNMQQAREFVVWLLARKTVKKPLDEEGLKAA